MRTTILSLLAITFSFSILLATEDATPPVFNNVNLSPTSINNGDDITITIDVEDDLSGIQRIQVDLSNPAGDQVHTAYGTMDFWTNLGNNQYSSDISISQWAVSGEWYVSDIYAYDSAGNSIWVSHQSETLPTFTVSSDSPDTTAPTLHYVDVNPGSIANGETVTVTVSTEDAVSGLDRIQVDLVNPEGGQDHSAFGSIDSWTDLGNNTYSYDVTITQWAISGEWYVSNVYLYDIADNSVWTSHNDSSMATFTVTSDSPDDTAPILHAIGISHDTIMRGQTFTVTVEVTDDVSGLDRIQVDMVNPAGEQSHTAFGPMDMWTSLGNNRYSFDLHMNEWAVGGEWYVEAVYSYDIAGNGLYTSHWDSTIATFIVVEYTVSDNDSDNNDGDGQTLSLPEYQKAPTSLLFPNPSSGIINIHAKRDIKQLNVYNNAGIQMYAATDNFTQINLGDVTRGLYLLQIIYDDHTFEIQKLLIE